MAEGQALTAGGGRAGGGTIFAVASPPGAGAGAVLRLSGGEAVAALAALAPEGGGELLAAPGGRGVRLVLQASGARIPAWALVHRAPRSYTREDLVEVFLPGSPAVLGAVARALEAAAGTGGAVRWAGPGEFTLRAVLGGRIDLAQAEAVAGLIAAAGAEEARAARRALRGELGERIEEVRAGALECLALIEAALDFPDEDLPAVSPPALLARLVASRSTLAELRRSTALRSPRDGRLRAVLAGFPNAGKSSLLNAILGRSAALTAAIPGTTRDPVRGVMTHGTTAVEWIDVAGSHDAEAFATPVEGEDDGSLREIVGRLTRIEIASADRVLWVADPRADLETSLREYRRLEAPARLLVIQKTDLLEAGEIEALARSLPDAVLVSARTRRGIDALVARTLAPAGDPGGPAAGPRAPPRGSGSPRFLTSAYQEARLAEADEALARAGAALRAGEGAEYAAADLRDALRALDELAGATPREAVLDCIFSRFCVGK